MQLKRFFLGLILALQVAASWSLDSVVFSNLNQPDSLPQLGQPLDAPIKFGMAVPFTTDSTNTGLTKVRLYIARSGSSDTINISIWSVNNSGSVPSPGVKIGNLLGPQNPDPGGSEYVSSSVTPLIPLTLQPDTSYYLIIDNNTSGSAAAAITRYGTASDLSPSKYSLGITGVNPTTYCSRANLSWDCSATVFSSNLFPAVEITAEPQVPVLNFSLTANPKQFDFGSVPLNTESTAQVFTIENDGTADQNLGQFLTPTGFLLKSDLCSNQPLAAGAKCNVSVAFAPTTGGQSVGALKILPDPSDPAQQYSIVLSGQSPAIFSIGGTLNGLAANETLVISNIATQQTLTVDGGFNFSSQNDGAAYRVAVDKQPIGQTCAVTNGAGTISGANVTNITIDCVDNHYKVGGLVSGLVTGDALVLQNNGQDDLTLTVDGSFEFASRIAYQSSYSVTVKTQPAAPSETCTVSNGAGTLGATDVNNVSVNCSVNNFTVGGTVSGYSSTSPIELRLNGALPLSLNADGAFVFPPLADASSYAVTVSAQPDGQTCSVGNGSGTLAGSNISNVSIDCVTDTFNVGGHLSGLTPGQTVVLINNGSDELILNTDGAFSFSTQVAYGANYSVAIKTDPVGESCQVVNGSGTVQGADINQVSVTCSADTYRVSGSLANLASGDSIELLLNNSLNTLLTGNGFFQFPALADGSSYDVTVGTQPNGQTCSVSNGTGTLAGADVSNVAVNCASNRVTGAVTGTNPSGATANITIAGCSSLVSAAFIPAPDSPSKPAGFDFPFGLIDFKASGCSTLPSGVQVIIDFSKTLDAGASFYKEEGATNAYFPFSATISGARLSYFLTDNGTGDEDAGVGDIHDPAGIAVPVAQPPPAPDSPAKPVPLMPIHMTMVLAIMMSLAALSGIRRRRF